MRNANKYTGLYGGTLVFEEDNILRITILLDGVADLQVGTRNRKIIDRMFFSNCLKFRYDGILKCLRTEERTFKFVLLRDVCFADICVYFAI